MVLGPEFPVIERMMDYYHMNVLLKINKSLSLNEVKKILQSEILKIKTNSDYKSTYISVDVDPNQFFIKQQTRTLNSFGLQHKNVKRLVVIFKLNRRYFPISSNKNFKSPFNYLK